MHKAKTETAAALLDLQPSGTSVKYDTILVWLVKVAQFLLVEYITQHRYNK